MCGSRRVRECGGAQRNRSRTQGGNWARGAHAPRGVYRLYLARDGDELIILFVGGIKKRQQADIARARGLLAEYKTRRAAVKKAKR